MKTKLTVALLTLCLWMSAAQNPIAKLGKKLKAESFELTVFNNQTYFPFVGMGNIVRSKYHPGLSFGYSHNLKEKKKRTLYLDYRVGVFNHRFIQTGVQLYSNIGYRFELPRTFFVATEFGLGYLHSIKQQTTFEADADGSYKKVANWGRPQLMTGIGIKLGKQVSIKEKDVRIYLNYQPWFQLPFIKSYVPLMPNNSLHLGFDFILK